MAISDAVSAVSVVEDCLAELLFDRISDKTSFAVLDGNGQLGDAGELELKGGKRLTPYPASNNLIAAGCVLFPSAVGDFGDKAELLADICAYLGRYVDLSPTFEEIAAHYVLLSWVYDAFNEIGMLRLQGSWGSGKTRGLLAIGSICYKPFFASGASTVSPIFHILDAIGGTLVLDEADLRFSDKTADLTKILNNGTVRGLPVLRTMTNRNRELNPQAFRVFGPKIIAMRERFEDDALESRFITEYTGRRPLPPHIPLHLPNSLAQEAEELRNKLLAWRFATLRGLSLDPSRAIEGVPARVNQLALPLLSLVDDPSARERITRHLIGEAEEACGKWAASDDAVLVSAIREKFEAGRASVSVAEVADTLRQSPAYEGVALTNKHVGWMLRSRLRVSTAKSNGIYVVPVSERARLDVLAHDLGVADRTSETVH